MLPLLPFIASGAGGFVIGYLTSGKNEERIVVMDPITFNDMQVNTVKLKKKLKKLSYRKELKKELISFDKTKLKHLEKKEPHNTDSIIMQNLRNRILQRRASLNLDNSLT